MFQFKSSPRMLNVATTVVKGCERALLVFLQSLERLLKRLLRHSVCPELWICRFGSLFQTSIACNLLKQVPKLFEWFLIKQLNINHLF